MLGPIPGVARAVSRDARGRLDPRPGQRDVGDVGRVGGANVAEPKPPGHDLRQQLHLVGAQALAFVAPAPELAPAALHTDSGSFCFSFRTGWNRSPICSTRCSTASESKTRKSGSRASRQPATSSHVTGVETVGRSRARSEYTLTVVLYSSFWLQSISTLPSRSVFRCMCTTCFGRSRSSFWARPLRCAWSGRSPRAC